MTLPVPYFFNLSGSFIDMLQFPLTWIDGHGKNLVHGSFILAVFPYYFLITCSGAPPVIVLIKKLL